MSDWGYNIHGGSVELPFPYFRGLVFWNDSLP